MSDKDMLLKALEGAVALYKEKTKGSSLLGEPSPDAEVLEPLKSAIKSCYDYKAVAGHMLFSANSGVIIDASRLAVSFLYRGRVNILAAVDWLLRLLQTRETVGQFRAAIWGISIDQEIPLTSSSRLLPFSQLPESSLKEWVVRRAQPEALWDGSVWVSPSYFAVPQVAFVTEVPDFPYIRTDNASLKKMESLEQHAMELWAVLEAASVGHPLAFGYWFEYIDRDLDYNSSENAVMWGLPEVTPRISRATSINAAAFAENLTQYLALPPNLRETLLRSMNRFTQSQCRHQLVDRILDLTLAFEIAVSGSGENGPPKWKVSVRSAQLIGGDLRMRQENRRKVADLYNLRNQASHGSSLKDADKRTLAEAMSLYQSLVQSMLRLGIEPDWNALELEPAFT